MAGYRAKKWIKETVEKIDRLFGGKKQESKTDPKLDPIEAYNAYMREAFALMAQMPNLSESTRQLYKNGFEEVDYLDIDLYDVYG